ncbi:kelch-like protein 24 [Folsomia candida]|uniref:kelch-like protein 24 n=1 Tax=Folsomia candida TaxID=158441 RepID=UPI001605455E|nr:kelch-like protein 24 [Folsomia candida]
MSDKMKIADHGKFSKNGRDTSPRLVESAWDWRVSHDDRILNLLETGFQSDLTLHLGAEGVKVPVHRIFFQASSPVLNGKLKASVEDLVIANVDSRIFKILLKYLYTGTSDVGMGDALQLMQLATEFEINGLRDDCATVLKGDLTCENVLGLFESGMEYAHGDFIQSTLKFICTNARQILKRDEFAKLRLECLIEIIQQDSLIVMNEMEVFEAVNRWGLAECARLSLDPDNTENLGKCLAKPLNYIRFPLMNPEEFALNVTSKKLLNTDESMELLTCFLVSPERRKMLPQGRFVSRPRTYVCKRVSLKRSITGGHRIHITGGNAGEAIMVRVTANSVLKSISIFKDNFDVYGANYVYYYDQILATITMSHGILNEQKFTGQARIRQDNEYFRIDVDPPVQLNVDDGWVKITISFSGQIRYHFINHPSYSNANATIINLSCMMVGNYEDLFSSSVVDSMGIVDIKRPEGDNLSVKSGLIENLEFELA